MLKFKSSSVVTSLTRDPSVFIIKTLPLSKHDGVDGPGGISFNNDFTKLFIINGEATVLV
jgi:hypothetical protein